MTAPVSGFDVDQPLYPLLPFTEGEAVKVVSFGMHKKQLLNEDTRAGFVILAGVVGFMVVALVVGFGLIWLGVKLAHL